MESIRLILALAAKEKLDCTPFRCEVSLLKRELRRRFMAPRSWNAKLDKVLKELGFRKCAQDQAVYKLQSKNTTLIIGVYVDDIIVTGSSEKQNSRVQADQDEGARK
ncbi:zinc finger, CCHC-type containing protein [Tanacetum coccineum]